MTYKRFAWVGSPLPVAALVKNDLSAPGVTKGCDAPAPPTKLSTARFLKYGDAEPSASMLARMVLKPMPPAKPCRLIEEKSAAIFRPSIALGCITMPMERDVEVAGCKFGLLPSSPLNGSPVKFGPKTPWITPAPTCRVSVGPYSAYRLGALKDF